MTRYSFNNEAPPQNLANPTELDSSDWESRMEKLVGLKEKSLSVNTEIEESASSLQPKSQPQDAKTDQPLSSNPFAKLGLVSAATLGIVLVAGVFLSQLMNTGKQQPKKNNSVSTPSQPISDSRPQQLESELETLKTKLALTEQAEAVKAAQQKLRLEKPTPSPVLASRPTLQPQPSARVNTPRIALQRIPTPVRTVYVPRTVTVERVVKVASAPQKPIPQKPILQKPANSQIPSRLPIVAPNTQPIVTATPTTPDPLQEWAKLAKLGSYGMVSMTENSVKATTPTPTPEPVNNTRLQARNTEPDDEPEEESTPAVSQTKQQTPKSVAVGTKAKGVFATAVFGETTRQTTNSNRKDSSGKDVFVVRLKEPLKSVDGAIALPAKTEFLAQVRSISEQGFLQLDVVKVIVPNNNSFTERSLPPNAITIRANAGKPLIASQYSNQGGSGVGLADVGAFVLNGVGKGAQIYNSPETRIVCPDNRVSTPTNGNDLTTVVTNNCFSTSDSRRNILAGVLEGGATTLGNQINQRNQQNISRRQAQRTNVWFLPAGKEIEIYVNQTTQF